MRGCDCGTRCDDGGHVVSISTCPQCLPAGAITWLIENGRQLELFEEEGVGAQVRGLESIEKYAQDPVIPEIKDLGLPF